MEPTPLQSPLTRFSAAAEDYHRFRPGYPAQLFDWILAEGAPRAPGPPGRVLDLACGTGIVARELVRRGLEVVGVDPNPEMLAHARASVSGRSGPRWLRAAAERLPLTDSSISLAVCGQAFHWFDLERTVAELRRILCPGGWSAAFWSERVARGPGRDYDDLIDRYSSEYARVRRASPTLAGLREALQGAEVSERSFPNEQLLDLEGLIGRAFSSSYVVHGVDDPDGLRAELEQLFERFAHGGHVRLEYETVALAWRSDD